MTDMTYAQVRCNDAGEWKLLVHGTDIYQTVYRYRDPLYEPFPGNALGHRLIELGWMPDRRRMYGEPGMTAAEKLSAAAMAGWSRGEDRWVWTIPCTPIRQ